MPEPASLRTFVPLRLGTLLGALAVLPGVAAAHAGETHSPVPPLLPPVLFVASLAILGTTLVLDRRDEISRRLADVGVAIGVIALLAAVALFGI